MKQRIECIQHSLKKRSWEVTPEGRVWPCCFFGNGWDKRLNKEDITKLNPTGSDKEYMRLMGDPEFKELMETDPTWNSLEHHSFDDIVNHTYYWNNAWFPGWESDNPPPICAFECSVEMNPITGEEQSPRKITLNQPQDNK